MNWETYARQEQWGRVFASSAQLALLATADPSGLVNLAPSGTLVRVNQSPLDVSFTVATNSDTAALALGSGEFVAGLVGFEAGILKRVLSTAAVPSGIVDEPGRAGLTTVPSSRVAVPGVAECYARLEARVLWSHEWDGRVQVCGRVLAVVVDGRLLDGGGNIVPERLNPAHFLGGSAPARFAGLGRELLL